VDREKCGEKGLKLINSNVAQGFSWDLDTCAQLFSDVVDANKSLNQFILGCIEFGNEEGLIRVSPGKISIENASQEDYEAAEIYLRDGIKKVIKDIKSRFTKQRELEKISRELQKKMTLPFLEDEKGIKGMMEDFQLKRIEDQEKFIDKAKAYIEDDAKIQRGRELQVLISEGRTDDALVLSGEPIKTELDIPEPSFRPMTGKASSVRMSWKYTVVDEKKIRDKYMTPPIAPAPDRIIILRTVRKMGKDAEGEVGEGSIKVERDLTVASLSERKAER